MVSERLFGVESCLAGKGDLGKVADKCKLEGSKWMTTPNDPTPKKTPKNG